MKIVYLLILFLIVGCNNTPNASSEISEIVVNDSAEIAEITTTQTLNLSDKKVKILWREQVYYTQLQDSVNTIMLDTNYFKTMSDAERAAIGYVATFIGSECSWEGEANEDMSNLSCKLIQALSLGYQCSENHLGFLRKWLAGDQASLTRLSDCPLTPYTATQQSTFDNMSIEVIGNVIKITSDANEVNMNNNTVHYWQQTDTFMVEGEHLTLLKSERSKERTDNFLS